MCRLGRDKTTHVMVMFICKQCQNLSSSPRRCLRCGSDVGKFLPGQGLGLIGFTCEGKTCLLAAMHDQLMHGAPEWHVEVSDDAFDKLTGDFWRMCQCVRPSATMPFGEYFAITIEWNGTKVPLVSVDIFGGAIWNLAEGRHYHHDPDLEEEDPYLLYLQFLRQCKAILVAINCEDLSRDERLPNLGGRDGIISRFFRRLLRESNALVHVQVVLIGVDRFGAIADDAVARAVRAFELGYRTFPGVLKNAGISVDVVGVSNFGLGNENLDKPPKPFNVLEPLRRSLIHYLPNKSRRTFARAMRSIASRNAQLNPRYMSGFRVDSSPRQSFIKFLRAQIGRLLGPAPNPEYVADPQPHSAQGGGNAPTRQGAKTESDSESLHAGNPARRAFLSYRRESSAATARLLRASLASRGWNAFLDVDDLGSSHFDDRLLLEIKRAEAFIVVLSPGSLDRCCEPSDWLRREISHAIKWKKRIVPVVKDGFTFDLKNPLPADLSELPRYNCVQYSHQYFDATIERLLTFLTDQEVVTDNQ
jgi:hypothetical protein